MTSREHKKHTDLVRPYGNFGRNEWALVGGKCEEIKQLAGAVIEKLAPRYKCAYADASHKETDTQLPGRLASGAFLEYTDDVNYHEYQFEQEGSPYTWRAQFAAADLVLVNGNHHLAKAQVVLIDETKKASLQKRVDQLKNVQMILLADNVTDVFDFIKELIPEWQFLPVYRIGETEKIIRFFEDKLIQAMPPLYGLVLAGGKSQRMGTDKGTINLYGVDQRYHTAHLIQKYCREVYISCRADQQADLNGEYPILPDTFTGLGPFGAILSALREKPDVAWLVLACDLPLMDEATLDQLVAARHTASIATTFKSPQNEFPEPLITIWEPKSYPVMLSFLAQGYSCPRKVLINSEKTLLDALHPEALTNVNTPEELEAVKPIIHQRLTSV